MGKNLLARSLILVNVLFCLWALPAIAHDDPNPPRVPLVVTTQTDKTVYAPREPVRIRMTVYNPQRAPVTLHFHTFQLHDFFVRDLFSSGEVWRWSSGMFFAQALTSRVLRPGERWILDTTWNQTDNNGQPVGPGFYAARGRATSHPPYDSSGSTFQIRR